MSMKTETRVSKYLARAGLASRREAEKLIISGRVSVNNIFIADPWKCIVEGDMVKLDGEKVKTNPKTKLFLLNKPKGCLSTSRDQRGRKTIFDLFQTQYDHLMIIGRLDYNSEGLILLTNNGNLKRYLELPKNEFKRFYKVKIRGILSENMIEQIQSGVTVQGINYRPMELEVQSENKQGDWLNICLREGKNREIRRILDHYNIEVIRLIRVGFGPFALQNLPVGKIKKVRIADYKELINIL